MACTTDWKFYVTVVWHVFAFIMVFACLCVPMILEAEAEGMDGIAARRELFGWPFIQLSQWLLVSCLVFLFASILLDIVPHQDSLRRTLDSYFSLVMAEASFVTIAAIVCAIAYVSLPQEEINKRWHNPAAVDLGSSSVDLLVWLCRYFFGLIVVLIDGFTNYHFNKTKRRVGVCLVILYSVVSTLWHVLIYLKSGIWPQFFEAFLTPPQLAACAVAATLLRICLYLTGIRLIHKRWEKLIRRDLSFAPFRGRRPRNASDIPAIGGLDAASDRQLLLEDQEIDQEIDHRLNELV